jgi:diguanylate cyclase (GGDEF)-like protein
MTSADQTIARAALQAGIRRIWENAQGVVAARLDVLEHLANTLLEQPLTPEQHQLAEREAHKLAGALGTFGFMTGSAAARELELMLVATKAPDAGRWNALILVMRKDLENQPSLPGSTPPVVADGRPILAILEPDSAFSEALAEEANSLGLEAVICKDLNALRAALMRDPAAVILDPWSGSDGALNALHEHHDRRPDAALLVVSDREDLEARVEAARSGVRAFLPRPQAARDVAAQLAQLLSGAATQTPGILAVTAETETRGLVADALSDAGLKLTLLDDPFRLWGSLSEVNPDLLLLDASMSTISGVELCRVLRSDARWRPIPVIIIDAQASAETRQAAFAAGADDVVLKSAIPAELTGRIRNRLRRTEQARLQADTDYLTGVPSQRKSEESISYLMSLALRHKQSLSLALLDLDHFGKVNEAHGHAAGDQCLRRFAGLLRQTFRGVDVISRWSSEDFVVGLYGMGGIDAVHRLGDLLDRLRTQPIALPDGRGCALTFSAGVSQFLRDGQSLDQLYRAADQAMSQAKAEGRARVVLAGSARKPDRPDVVVIEHDEDVSQHLLMALETRGYHLRRFSDGESALKFLAIERSVGPRLILLAADLPGANGLAVLHRLRQSGLLAGTRVIMLTERAADEVALAAFELDAFDRVSKPFTTTELMQSVRRALA